MSRRFGYQGLYSFLLSTERRIRAKQKTKKKKFEQVAKAPTQSPGSYYVRKGRNNTWYLMIETYIGGERKQRGVEQARFNDLGLTNIIQISKKWLTIFVHC